jgi:spectinomycin phosphotransferase
MLEKPRITDQQLITCLQETYGITAATIEFLPLGYDSYAGVYRVTASDGQLYFMKAKVSIVPEVAITIPRYLREQGMEQVVAPVPTTTGALWGNIDDYTILVYPFIEGNVGMEVGLTENQWREFSTFLRQLHAIQLPDSLAAQVKQETFIPHPECCSIIQRLQAEIPHQRYDHPLQQELARFWLDRQAEIARILARAEELGAQLQNRTHEFVLCHADIHTANIMISPGGALHIVDWDQPILAPRERDLMFVVRNPIGAATDSAVSAFRAGYGDYEVDALTLAYYRYEWVVQDIGEFARPVFFEHDLSDPARQQSFDGLMWLFTPGGSVDTAYLSENDLR